MTNPKRLSELCEDSPQFADKLREIVLSGPFNGLQYQAHANKWMNNHETQRNKQKA